MLRHVAGELFQIVDQHRMAPVAVAVEPHHLPARPIDRQRGRAGKAAARIGADGARPHVGRRGLLAEQRARRIGKGRDIGGAAPGLLARRWIGPAPAQARAAPPEARRRRRLGDSACACAQNRRDRRAKVKRGPLDADGQAPAETAASRLAASGRQVPRSPASRGETTTMTDITIDRRALLGGLGASLARAPGSRRPRRRAPGRRGAR